LAGDPDNNVYLTATPAFGGVDVTWTYPVINPFAVSHTLVYRTHSPNFTSAIERQIVAGNFFYDRIDDGLTYYYWIKLVSINGTVGELIGPASATARPLIDDLLEQLAGQIDADVLSQSLKGTLDNISLVGMALANETLDRQTGETSLAQALDDVQAGVAEAHTFIASEIASRVAANSAIAEQINLVAVTLGDSIAAVETSSSAWVETVDGVTTTQAKYFAKVTADGLVGGFGVYNNSTTVEAGFDVDTFWVGRTGADKRKPFIIIDGETFINTAIINSLTIDKLRTPSGGVLIQDGLIRADAVNLDWGGITGTGRPESGATRNVYRGNWAAATVYVAGDAVIAGGYGWACQMGHTSSALIQPPVFPITDNSYWMISTIKGDDGSVGVPGAAGVAGSQGIQGIQGVPGTQGIPGMDGTSTYFHIAYADNISGGGLNQSPVGKSYIGTYVDTTITDSANAAAYTWKLFVGTDGLNGADGVSGTSGSNGLTSYLHVAYATNSTGTTGFSTTDPTGTTYIGTYVDYTVADSTSPGAYAWARFKGADGAMDPAAKVVLSGGGGLAAGSLAWDIDGNRTSGAGTAMTSKGFLAHNGTVPTFVVNGITGDASFSGTLNVQSAPTGARLEIKNNVIKVYDGILSTPRVIIGDLTA
jgi:hypothetical protein